VSVLAPPRLHIPEAPEALGERWCDEVLAGADLATVITGPAGPAEWLWTRWKVLETAGLDHDAFVAQTLQYRRELWLWMAGERTWTQCCSGLIGRLQRRLPA
jgi:hypothetical protein